MRTWLVISAIAAALVAPAVGAQGEKPQSGEPPSPVVIDVSDGFHWKDAGVGAVAALALVTIGFGLALVLRDRPKTPPATWESDT